MYQALYREFRPKSFNQFIGQDHITQTLKNQISNGQISHAYLFCGTRGTGKTSAAKVFAMAINCLNPNNSEACLKCEHCIALQQPNNMDVLEIDAASNNRVDEIRDLREKVKYPPVNAKYKVYIIDEVHMLTDSAFNALLKTLEEPPNYVVFILATTEVQKLPATILSRCLRFDFKLVSENDLAKHLKYVFDKSGVKYEEQALNLIASLGEGSVRDALSVADTVAAFSNKNITYNSVLEAVGAINKATLFALGAGILAKDAKTIIQIMDEILNIGKSAATVVKDLCVYYKDLAVIKTVDNYSAILKYPANILKSLEETAKKHDIEDIMIALKTLSSLENEFRNTTNPRLSLEVCVLALIGGYSFATLEKRIEALENEQKKTPKTIGIQATASVTQKNIDYSTSAIPSAVWEGFDSSINYNNTTGGAISLKAEFDNNISKISPAAVNLTNQDEFNGPSNGIKDSGLKSISSVMQRSEIEVVPLGKHDNLNAVFEKATTSKQSKADEIFAKVLIALRTGNNMMLHAMLGSGCEVDIAEQNFIITLSDEVKFNTLNKATNFDAIVNALSNASNQTLILKVELKKQNTQTQVNINTESYLKELFGDKLVIQ